MHVKLRPMHHLTRGEGLVRARMSRQSHTYLDDGWVREGVKEEVHVLTHLQRVNQVVLETSRDLHQTRESEKAPIRVVLTRIQTR